jgi:CHAT domain-containing protein
MPGNGTGRQASVLHLACHALAGPAPGQSWLVLAGEERLPLSRILTQAASRGADAPGGLVVLAACSSALTVADHDEALTLAAGFLAAGAAGVIGARWRVPEAQTALLTFMLHHHLIRHPGDSPADALRAAQLWMTDPARRVPPEMPARLAAVARSPNVADPNSWAAFTHHGK